MPRSAQASGLIDFAVPVERMPRYLLQVRDGIDVLDMLASTDRDRQNRDRALQVQGDIARLLHERAGHDFSGYKNRTFMRRVARRMKVTDVDTVDEYTRRLGEDAGEVMALFRDLLINVTNFFRDADAFAALGEKVIPALLEGKGARDTVRVWVPGCATGEEVYSLAILLCEHVESLAAPPQVQIFATDIDEDALSVARAGKYPDTLMEGVTPERLKRFFRRDGAGNVVVKQVREMCVFSSHSIIADPPFSRMDLVSCRNLLIYFGGALQDQVIPTFHYALRPGGYLFLGTSEGVSRYGELFAPVDRQHRIFRSRDTEGGFRRLPRSMARLAGRPRAGAEAPAPRNRLEAAGVHLRQRAEMQVLERYAPAHVVVSQEGEILHYSTGTGPYLEMPRGAPSRQLLELARRDLRTSLRTALRQALETGRRAGREVLMLEPGTEQGRMARLTVEPLDPGGEAGEALFLVLFHPLGEWQEIRAVRAEDAGRGEAEAAMERELRDLRDRLQATVEEYEAAIEEVKSANEELVSVNEEVQSSNEALEAAREEAQSLNEELSTINAELASSVEELDQANTDLKNLYAATRIATIFLDHALVIRNFTPAAASFFNLRGSDIGRPLSDLSGVLDYPELEGQAQAVIRDQQTIEHRISSADDEAHYLVRLMPYRTRTEAIGGVVVTILDITSLARAERRQEVLIAELNHRVKNMLTVVISTTNSTLRTASDPKDFSEKLIGRLHGMARAYALLSQSEWSLVSVSDLVRAEAEAFGAERFEVSGPGVWLKPQQAMSLSMIVHELSTNAAKYGALSRSAGRVKVSWQETDGVLGLQWVERGGPEVSVPEKTGFGMVLVEGQVMSLSGGQVASRFPPEGFELELSFALER
ncbi:CheR family methyltransferase [Oceanicella sp. SM1341]|uniref:CheR family methyltransferase n=1 Tax=Oceanicella sp. SM1341 TaxID=1548889 RepID=UPI0018E515F4|nr:CheR family methyltransferase [Oceanicella sp. SM1341]